MRVAFRVDGSSQIGMGHIIRSMSLAKSFEKMEHEVVFISKEIMGIEALKLSGFEVISLEIINSRENIDGYSYENKNERLNDLVQLKEIFKKIEIDLLIVDSYNVDAQYFLKLKKEVKKIAYIDDIYKKNYDLDIWINGNIDAKNKNYEIDKNKLYLLGPKYNLIRDEFKNANRHKLNKDIQNIMITTGGTDYYELSIYLSNMLIASGIDANINIVVGLGFENLDKLIQLKDRNLQIKLFTTAKENKNKNLKYKTMPEIMSLADLAISSGGSTLYELCAMGTPTIAFILAENQLGIVKTFEELGYIENLGWYNEINEIKLINLVNKINNQIKLREKLSMKGQNLVDGKGSDRIVLEIEKWLD